MLILFDTIVTSFLLGKEKTKTAVRLAIVMTTDFIEETQSLDNATRWRHAIFFFFLFFHIIHPSNSQCREEEYLAGVSHICPKKIFSVYEYADKNRRDYSGAAAKIVCRPDCETREKSVYCVCILQRVCATRVIRATRTLRKAGKVCATLK